jgi:hypothetical protein
MTGLKQALCWIAVLLLPFLSVLMLYLAAYHAWAAGGPPNPTADWHAWLQQSLPQEGLAGNLRI